MAARWSVQVDRDHTVVVATTGDGRIVVEVVARRRGALLRFGRRLQLVAEPDVTEALRRYLGAAIGVARYENADSARCAP